MTLRSKVYIIEDNYEYRKKILQSLSDYQSNFVDFDISSMDNHLLFLNYLQTLSISDTDIFIFDIDLKTTFTGIDLAKEVRKKNDNCSIIFLTSLEDKAISIINSDIFPIGYIVKDCFSAKNLNSSMHKLLTKIEHHLKEFWTDNPDIVTLKSGAENIYINCKSILFIESIKGVRGQILIKTVSEDIILTGNIGKIKKLLPQPYLMTSLLSYIINLSAITSLDRASGIITFSNGQQLHVGISIIDKIKKVL
ncbi:LytR/AlgR family response regulator transcription factor [Enterococcus quebecensis]|uniref:Two-component system response regulator n=1 Tax=Enterococcus quebecensis TaxID=903983 RepID=A0A1E5GV07_9ENTE|nr:LytTR family transcriptional regulator DNA-binding domain-containing protein [Enterococcus quebecensis]OEG16508.1 two-component system response regulator [Enterococcus quebecensis]OJG74119.1 hypothetical protein RV12_GL002757 [Enterococcus quebecensis]